MITEISLFHNFLINLTFALKNGKSWSTKKRERCKQINFQLDTILSSEKNLFSRAKGHHLNIRRRYSIFHIYSQNEEKWEFSPFVTSNVRRKAPHNIKPERERERNVPWRSRISCFTPRYLHPGNGACVSRSIEFSSSAKQRLDSHETRSPPILTIRDDGFPSRYIEIHYPIFESFHEIRHVHCFFVLYFIYSRVEILPFRAFRRSIVSSGMNYVGSFWFYLQFVLFFPVYLLDISKE